MAPATVDCHRRSSRAPHPADTANSPARGPAASSRRERSGPSMRRTTASPRRSTSGSNATSVMARTLDADPSVDSMRREQSARRRPHDGGGPLAPGKRRQDVPDERGGDQPSVYARDHRRMRTNARRRGSAAIRLVAATSSRRERHRRSASSRTASRAAWRSLGPAVEETSLQQRGSESRPLRLEGTRNCALAAEGQVQVRAQRCSRARPPRVHGCRRGWPQSVVLPRQRRRSEGSPIAWE